MKDTLGVLQEFFGREFIVPVGSGTAGLLLVLDAVDVRGKRVLIPALACANVAVAVLAAGGVPTLVDVSKEDYCLSVDEVEAAINDGTGAIIAIDAFGYPADLDRISAIAARHGCTVIEDACQAYGGRVGERAMGAVGEVGVVSFGYSKPVELVGGGLVITRSQELHTRILRLKEQSSYDRLRALKNRIAVNLMLRDRYETMVSWARRVGLLRYDFPSHLWKRLRPAWSAFEREIDPVREHLSMVANHLAMCPEVEPFHYPRLGWLPWRYSFKAVDADAADKLTSQLNASGIRTSRLYQPVDEFLPVEAIGTMETARRLSTRTINLVYRSTTADLSRLVTALERFQQE